MMRLPALLIWVFLCYGMQCIIAPVSLINPALAKRLRRRVSRTWLKVMPPLLGLRIHVEGNTPAVPYFLVNNHITWIDFIAMNSLCRARCVAMAEMGTMPILSTLLAGLEPIYVQRTREDTARVLNVMTDALNRGESLQMAPEGTIGPGRSVRRFHAALLESAVRARRPIHYASITYRTPEGFAPASRRVLFGPDPYFKEQTSAEEMALWGKQRTFLGHVVRLLALPWYEMHVRFAPEPVWAEDRITLANELHRKVQHIFTPLD
jgi:1-acyl-sn-glycerol-3-phosphate acyltransferase